MPKIRVLLIEDNRLLREGITAMLNEQPDIRAVSATGNGDALEKAKKITPQVVLLDLGLRSQSSLRIAELIKKEYPESEIVVMDLIPAQAEVVEFVKAGVSGFILKDATIDDFLHTIRSVAKGKKVLPAPLKLVTHSLLWGPFVMAATGWHPQTCFGGGRLNLNLPPAKYCQSPFPAGLFFAPTQRR